MKSLETSTMTEQGAFQTAINASRDAGYARGVKRLRVGADEPEKRSSFQMQEPVRSFLETKWEPERGQKRREFWSAYMYFLEFFVNGRSQANYRMLQLIFTTKVCETMRARRV
jgi:hypothetical protein